MIVDCAWKLDDGSEVSGVSSLVHEYASSGVYKASVMVTDHMGNVGSAHVEITVLKEGASKNTLAIDIVPVSGIRGVMLGRRFDGDSVSVSVLEFFKPLSWEDSIG